MIDALVRLGIAVRTTGLLVITCLEHYILPFASQAPNSVTEVRLAIPTAKPTRAPSWGISGHIRPAKAQAPEKTVRHSCWEDP